MRNIMHNYPNEKCAWVLHGTMSAVDRNSVILIDDMGISKKRAHWRTTRLDMTMIIGFATMERAER